MTAWWAVTVSNRRPSRCKRDALPTELTAPHRKRPIFATYDGRQGERSHPYGQRPGPVARNFSMTSGSRRIEINTFSALSAARARALPTWAPVPRHEPPRRVSPAQNRRWSIPDFRRTPVAAVFYAWRRISFSWARRKRMIRRFVPRSV